MLFLPNAWLTVFGQIAGVVSAVYLVAQLLLLMELGYAWDEQWNKNALDAQLNDIRAPRINLSESACCNNPIIEWFHCGKCTGFKKWRSAHMFSMLAMFVLAVVELIMLVVNFTTGGARALVAIAFVLGLVLLFLSVATHGNNEKLCPQGNMLTSCIVLAYLMWLSYESLSMLTVADGGIQNLLPRWISLVICGLSLLSFAVLGAKAFTLAGPEVVTPPAQQALAAEQGEAVTPAPETTAAAAEDDDDVPEGLDVTDFTVECVVHAIAAVYIASALAPSRSNVTFVARVVAVGASILLYGWSLFASKIIKGRDF